MRPDRKNGRRPSTGPGARCSSCSRSIVWALTDSGRKMPVDLEPVPAALLPEARDGNLVLWFEVNEQGRAIGAQLVSYATDEQRRAADVPLWRAHFVTCPHVHRHRRSR
jgi:hypothetical protein